MAIIKIGNPAIDLDAAEIPNLSANKITSDTLADARVPDLNASKITAGTIADARLPANALNSNVSVPNQSAFRNIIINGDMSIAQRGTSVASITGNGYNTVDRYSLEISSLGTWTQSQSTDVPTGQGFAKSLKMDNTTADASLGTSDYIFMSQKFEGQNLQYLKKGTSSAESLTLSFWVKSNKTGTYVVEIRDADNDRNICKSYTISSSNTWEKKELTFAGDTTGALGNDNGNSLNCTWWLAAGTDFTSGTLATSWEARNNTDRAVGQVNLADSTANEWYITGVQLEAGTSASDFEFLPYDVSLNRCYRYYYKMASSGFRYVGWGQVDNDNLNIVAYIDFKTNMRTAPTAVETTGTASNYQIREALTYTCSAVPTFNNADLWYAAIAFKKSGITSSNGFAQGEMLKCGTNNGYLACSAEL